MEIYVALIGLALMSGVICAKWAMDLGFSQASQILWGIAGLIAGPGVLFLLYVRLLRGAPQSSQRWF
jgi:hypothetical protein